MKPSRWRRERHWNPEKGFRFVPESGRYYRQLKTVQEKRLYEAHRLEAKELGYKVRHRDFCHALNTWDDHTFSRYYGRSWKDFHRCRKQYEVRFVRTPLRKRDDLFRFLNFYSDMA